MLKPNWLKNLFKKNTPHLYPNWDQARGILRMRGYTQRDGQDEYTEKYITITIELCLGDTQLVEFWTKLGTQEEADKTLKLVNKVLSNPVIESDEKGIQNFIRKAKNNLRDA